MNDLSIIEESVRPATADKCCPNREPLRNVVFRILVTSTALITIICLAGIIFSIFREGLPFFKVYSPLRLIGGTQWYPTHGSPEFGAFSLIIGSILVSIGALVFALPLGLGSAIFISEIAGTRLKEIAKPVIELLAAIPSVVYGLFGMAFLAPLIRETFHLETGLNLFSASLILGLMIVPIIASMSEDALAGVPRSLREAALALGSTKWETISKIVVPAAGRGIIGSVLLGLGRAIGETMVVLMVAGGATKLPDSIFSPIRPLTSTIAAEMGETVIGDLHYRSLFALAIILFLMTFTVNMIANSIVHRRRN
ncbi:MAG: phosphate ABC transporter permease subunit PstC [Candidatus Cloacimonetes bacterium HGW-Cloacimonetes-2]|jgi:phosphate transport system permease protein|nr:MAG: phosphate ABC transporter permease subunit PstC [Candidatus Cloacimonetes bacterium HGW-Cloacimonetes-2]